jgi:hypothetical protein
VEVTVDTAERALEDRQARTLPMPAGVALGFGCFLTLFSGGMFAGVLPAALRQGGALYVAVAMTVVFLMLTLALVAYGARGLLRRARGKRRAALHPGEPWYEDWDWDPAEAVAQRGRLQFATFPFFLGRTFEGRLTAKGLAGREDVVVTLRCLEERYVTHKVRNSAGHQLSVGVFQLYEARGTASGNAGASVSFLLPDADLGTHLRGELPRYWQLEVEATGTDPIHFLVPVYRYG